MKYIEIIIMMCILQVSADFVRLNIDGEIVGEKSLSSLINKDSPTSSFGKLALANIGGHCDSLQGYVHNVEVLPPALSIKDHWGKVRHSFSFLIPTIMYVCFLLDKYHMRCQDVPLKLSIDNSSASEIEVGDDGVWSIVGGKVRKIFYIICCLVILSYASSFIVWNQSFMDISLNFLLKYDLWWINLLYLCCDAS